jgi:hypothetical protein
MRPSPRSWPNATRRAWIDLPPARRHTATARANLILAFHCPQQRRTLARAAAVLRSGKFDDVGARCFSWSPHQGTPCIVGRCSPTAFGPGLQSQGACTSGARQRHAGVQGACPFLFLGRRSEVRLVRRLTEHLRACAPSSAPCRASPAQRPNGLARTLVGE